MEDLHVYLRTIEQDERTSLSVLASLVHPGATVLDLGCGSGSLGQFLSQTKGCTLDGVTLSDAEAVHAQPHYRRVLVDNLETCDLTATFAGQRYDYIVCADVLEHLSRPEQVLAACRQLLTPEGRLLISVPNAGYIGLIAELLDGEFLYREEGLLDRTHLRFFTRRSLTRFLGAERWALDAVDTIVRELPESEFHVAFDRLPPAVGRHFLGAPDALTYQFICVARPVAEALAPQPPQTAPSEPAYPRFSAELYLGHNGQYDEARKLTASGVIGQERQTLRFDLPAQDLPVTQLRLDPADRPGFVHLYRLSLRTLQGETLWQWSADQGAQALLGATPQDQIIWQAPLPAAVGTTLLLVGDEPWFELPITPALLASAPNDGLQLDIELGWPMSADYVALSGVVAPLQAEQTFLRTQVAHIPQILQEREKLALEHAQLHGLHADLHRQQDALLQQLATEQRERQHLFAGRNFARQEVAELQSQLQGMVAHVNNLSNLRSVRYTRALTRWLRPASTPTMSASAASQPLIPAPASATPTATEPTALPVPAAISNTVDVIVPVYRGLADTQLCVESVLASPVAVPYRLIVINDASPEPEVTAWLRDKAAQEPRLTLLENEHNLGFVGTVNRGMKHSTSNDVLLLNSDTEVANDWLDRLRRCAYASAKGGSVTPFSSNATICSYPVFCAANPLPAGETTASLDRLFAQANAQQAIDVPTGVGFCMYIRRDCLDAVGWFDEAHFGKGYGEENDFCQRAQNLGWRNLHALNTYVLHTGGVSFGESKSPREQAAMETLRRLHPAYEAQVMAFVQQDPARTARLAVDWLRATGGGRKPVVLAVQHQRSGGTERHVLELAQTLGDALTFVSLKPSGTHHVQLQLIETQAAPLEEGSQPLATLSDSWNALFDLNQDRAALLHLLRTLGVVHVHVHHLLGHHQWAWDLPRELGVGYDFTSHDFYSFCTHITLTGKVNHYQVDAQGECCGGIHPPSLPGVVEKIDDWRIRNRIFLEGARRVLAPSLDTASRMQAAFPSARVRFAPHTDLDRLNLPTPRPQPLLPQQPLRIAIIGALSVIKGADMLEATARLAQKSGAALEFHLIGFGYRHLNTSGGMLTVHGEYDEAQLPALLQRIAPHLVWFPALWPETYSYTLSATLQAALPVVVPNLGAFAERVAQRPWSWVHAWDSTPQQWLDLFLQIREHLTADMGGTPPTAPPLAPPLQALEARLGTWQYERDYLEGFPVTESRTAAEQAQQAHEIAKGFTRAQPTRGMAQQQGGLYGLALRLQRAPLLGPLVRSVPQSWRYRIKHLLSR
jgi:GT2 family glycosyltransferase/2-polyprenyl-3-methyl-5-hydroxy-6-metoxy-1,4-benzoquinol methylase